MRTRDGRMLTGDADGPHAGVRWAHVQGASLRPAAGSADEGARSHQRRLLAAALPAAADARHARARARGGRRVRRRPAAATCGPRASASWRCRWRAACRRCAQWRAFRALVRLIRARAARPGARAHADQRLPGAAGRARSPACRVSPTPATASCSTSPARGRGAPPRCCMEWIAGRVTDSYLTVSEEEAADARRLRHLHRAGRPSATAATRPVPSRRRGARARARRSACRRTRVVVVVSRLVRHKGYPELLAAMADVPDAELWVVGDRLASDHGEDLEPALAAAGPGRPAAPARLPRPTSPACWRRPTSSRCPAISRACRCR